VNEETGLITPGTSVKRSPFSEGLFQFSHKSLNETTKIFVDNNGEFTDVIKIQKRATTEIINKGVSLYNAQDSNKKFKSFHYNMHKFSSNLRHSLALVSEDTFQLMEDRNKIRSGERITVPNIEDKEIVAYSLSSSGAFIVALLVYKDTKMVEKIQFLIIDVIGYLK
jgi:hypothetical protein